MRSRSPTTRGCRRGREGLGEGSPGGRQGPAPPVPTQHHHTGPGSSAPAPPARHGRAVQPTPPHPPAAATAYMEEDFIIHVGVPGAFVLHPGVLDTHRGQLLRHKHCLSAQRLPQHRPPRGGRCPPPRAACPAPGSTTPTLAAGEPPAPSALGTSRPPALPSAQRPSPWCSAQGCSHPRCPAPAPELTPGPKAPHGPPPPPPRPSPPRGPPTS